MSEVQMDAVDAANEKRDAAIDKMFDMARMSNDGAKALQFSQSALNLSSAKAILNGESMPVRNSRKAN